MQLHFYKYQGTGNDFIILDNRTGDYSNLAKEQIAFLCDRHFGIGADGLMLLGDSVSHDFLMTYYNSDGNESTMCGNGGRCMVAFAHRLGLLEHRALFMAIDGEHEGLRVDDRMIHLKMNDVHGLTVRPESFELNTGSPHYVHYIDEVKSLDVKKEGALIRYSPLYKDEGINVNFVEPLGGNKLFVRTYERGVEDETLSCGTGVTAAALTLIREQHGAQVVEVDTPGGQLTVRCHNADGQHFHSIWLCGPAGFVFEGQIIID